MATALGMVHGIRFIVRLRQMLLSCRNKALPPSSSACREAKPDVPKGNVAIYVGREGSVRRFVIRATYLNHPVFMKLLSEAEEEYGFGRDCPLTIPCDKFAFEDAIRMASCSQEIGCRKAEWVCRETGLVEPNRGGIVVNSIPGFT